MYFRWLHPLLTQDQSAIDSHPVSYVLSYYYHLRNVTNCGYHQLPLLSPASRSQGLNKQRIGTLDMLYRAMDYLPRTSGAAAAMINTATAIFLPLQAVFFVPSSSSFVVPRRVKEMLVTDVFQYDAPLNFVPVIQQFRLLDSQSLTNVKASAKTFRLSVFSSSVPPLLALRNISAAHWKFFWSLSLTTIQHNVIYRFILGCIPHRRYLHRILPLVFESPLRPVCLLVEDSPSHLLFYCPSKEKVCLVGRYIRISVAHYNHQRSQRGSTVPGFF
ncbi:hypothetical protein PS15m_011795 [Mucor circinelloides]